MVRVFNKHKVAKYLKMETLYETNSHDITHSTMKASQKLPKDLQT